MDYKIDADLQWVQTDVTFLRNQWFGLEKRSDKVKIRPSHILQGDSE